MDTEAYKGRNVVERSFNTLKQWRGLATRFDKHAINYRAAVVLSAVIAWLKTAIVDTPCTFALLAAFCVQERSASAPRRARVTGRGGS